MANPFQFSPGQVPMGRPTRPFQVPENRGTADIIMQAAQMSQEAQLAKQRMQQQSLGMLQDAIQSSLSLLERQHQDKAQNAQAQAMLSLKEREVANDEYNKSAMMANQYLNPNEQSFLENQLGLNSGSLANTRLAALQAGMPQVFVDASGNQFSAQHGAKLIPAQKPPQNPGDKPLPAEVVTKKTLAEDALKNLNDIETMLSSPKARELMVKAGGSFSKLKSLADPQAESLANAIKQAGDAEARFKTGAQINKDEMDFYFNSLVDPTGTMAGTSDRLARKRSFFNLALKNMGVGRGPQGSGPVTPQMGAKDAIVSDFKSGKIDRETAKARLKALGI